MGEICQKRQIKGIKWDNKFVNNSKIGFNNSYDVRGLQKCQYFQLKM